MGDPVASEDPLRKAKDDRRLEECSCHGCNAASKFLRIFCLNWNKLNSAATESDEEPFSQGFNENSFSEI